MAAARVKALVMSLGVFDFFFQRESEAVFNREDLWCHSIGTAMAARLIARWNFPHSLVDTVSYHHEVGHPHNAHQELTAIVHLADTLCQAEGIGFSGNNGLSPVNDHAWTALKLSPRDMESLGAQLRQEKGCIEALLAAPR